MLISVPSFSIYVCLPFWQSVCRVIVGSFLRCAPPSATIARWGASPVVAISRKYTTVYNGLAAAHSRTLRSKGLGYISRPGIPGRLPVLVCKQKYRVDSNYRANRATHFRRIPLARLHAAGWAEPSNSHQFLRETPLGPRYRRGKRPPDWRPAPPATTIIAYDPSAIHRQEELLERILRLNLELA